MTKTNVQSTPSNSQRHDTPNNKTHVIKFRVTVEEKASLELTCKLLNLSLSTFIRRAIHNVKIEKTVIVAGGGEETLTAVSTLLAQCSKVGGNLNQLARHFNSGGALCMNRVHGEKVNTFAAEKAVNTTGNLCRCIWMPTQDAVYQNIRYHGKKEGIPVLDDNGHQHNIAVELTCYLNKFCDWIVVSFC